MAKTAVELLQDQRTLAQRDLDYIDEQIELHRSELDRLQGRHKDILVSISNIDGGIARLEHPAGTKIGDLHLDVKVDPELINSNISNVLHQVADEL